MGGGVGDEGRTQVRPSAWPAPIHFGDAQASSPPPRGGKGACCCAFEVEGMAAGGVLRAAVVAIFRSLLFHKGLTPMLNVWSRACCDSHPQYSPRRGHGSLPLADHGYPFRVRATPSRRGASCSFLPRHGRAARAPSRARKNARRMPRALPGWLVDQALAGRVALALAMSTREAKPSASWMAISLSILRLRATPALARPSMKRL